jgi:hypothetical protein
LTGFWIQYIISRYDHPPAGSPGLGRTVTSVNIIDQITEISTLARERGIILRALGGGAVFLHSQHPERAPWRTFGDLDFVGQFKQAAGIKEIFGTLGFTSDKTINTLHGRHRLIFEHMGTGMKVDVLLDVFRMCHELPLVDRLELDWPTIPLADLLLTKLQILKLNRKDADDVMILLESHPVGEGDVHEINARYIAELGSRDWGLYHTVSKNLEVLRATEAPPGVDRGDVDAKITLLEVALRRAPKSLRWRARAKVGERYPWYEEVEEVDR